jgi:hypothetical protein
MAPFSAGVALAPATRSFPAFRFCGCEGLASESFPLLVPFLPLLTSRAAVFQAFRFLANMSNQDIKIDCRSAVDNVRGGQELRGESRQLIWDASEYGAFVLLVCDAHARSR